MKLQRDIVHEMLKRVTPVIFMAVPCTLILPTKISGFFIILLGFVWLILTVTSHDTFRFRLKGNIFLILYLTFFALQIVSLLYSADLRFGLKNVESKLSFLVFPLILFSGYNILSLVNKKTVFIAFAQSIFIVSLFMLANIVWETDRWPEAWSYYTFKNLSGIIGVHPGYLSLYIGFSILIIIFYFNAVGNYTKLLFVFELVLFCVLIFRLTSRMPIAGLIVCLLIYIFFERKFKILLVGVLMFGLSLLVLSGNNTDIKERYFTPLKLILGGNIEGLKTYAFDRIQIYSCVGELLSGPAVITGVGTGDANQALIACYDKHDYWWVSRQRYNAHNEFFQSTLEVGIFGGLIFFALLVLPASFWSSSKLFVMFTVLFGIFSLTESTLQVQKGVVFFSFFHALFVSFTIKHQNTST